MNIMSLLIGEAAMPKRSEDYFEQKRYKILDAAYEVCMKKPMHEVSMRDVITESGLSQGGIYRYFSNLDDILIALINWKSANCDVKILVNSAILSDDIPEKIIGKLFGVWENAILDHLVGVGKIFYETCQLYVNDQERLIRFVSENRISTEEAYLKEKFICFISQKISEGYFNPKLPIQDILSFLVTSFDGIVRDLILIRHYPISNSPLLEKSRLVISLCSALVLLLGGNEKLIY